MAADYGSGVCPRCGGMFRLRRNGGLRHHKGDRFYGGWRQVCDGVGQKPLRVVSDGV